MKNFVYVVTRICTDEINERQEIPILVVKEEKKAMIFCSRLITEYEHLMQDFNKDAIPKNQMDKLIYLNKFLDPNARFTRNVLYDFHFVEIKD